MIQTVSGDSNASGLNGGCNGSYHPVSFQSLSETLISEPKQIANLQIQELNNSSSFKLLELGDGCHVAKSALDMQVGNTEERSEQGMWI